MCITFHPEINFDTIVIFATFGTIKNDKNKYFALKQPWFFISFELSHSTGRSLFVTRVCNTP